MKRFCIILAFMAYLSPLVAQDNITIPSIRESMKTLDWSRSLSMLKKFEPDGEAEIKETLYLRAELYLLLGNEKYNTFYDSLKALHATPYTDILELKHSIFIGSGNAPELLDQMLVKYPDNPELQYCRWLLQLQEGQLEKCRDKAASLSNSILFAYAPWLALYYNAWSRYDYEAALYYMDAIEKLTGKFYGSRYRELLKLLADIDSPLPDNSLIELPYAECGPGMGMIIEDMNGRKLKMELDTGTGYGFFTVIDSLSGAELSGTDTLVIEDGIWYNYMPEAEDFNFKYTDLSQPAYKNKLIGYFNGEFSKADGCFSPFFFRYHAIHIDPLNKKVYLRSEKNLNKYRRKNRDRITSVPYQIRNGWIYIPCSINGREVEMMIETGSRDVNFNMLSTCNLGLDVYDDFIKWQGKDYPVKKTDCTLLIGDKIRYEVKGGLVSDFVLGNLYYGTGSAGDLGPEFFKNYSFIIDPFRQEIIFVD